MLRNLGYAGHYLCGDDDISHRRDKAIRYLAPLLRVQVYEYESKSCGEESRGTYSTIIFGHKANNTFLRHLFVYFDAALQ